ncbi:MAG: deoxyribonuclease IV [Chloroflexi bacterium]|nr:deoxyribonuclease IV [Chloroflexota bacterium]
MLPTEPRIGVHLPLGGGMVRAVERAAEIGATAIQVFADNPATWHRRAAPPRELPAFRAALDHHGIGPVAIHAAYLVNLAGDDHEFAARSAAVLEAELNAAPGYGASIVNVHTGSHRETSVADGIQRLARSVADVLRRVEDGPGSAILVLENSAGGGWAVGTSTTDLARIADAAARLGVPEQRLGFCLDTAHAWGAGVHMHRADAIDRFLDDFDRRIGLGRLRLVHLNDSKAGRGSHQDRHEHLGAGRIGAAGLGHLLRDPRLRGIPFIAETPGMDVGYDAINVARARAMLAGLPLEPLPPEAFEITGSRSRAAAPDADVELPIAEDARGPVGDGATKRAGGRGTRPMAARRAAP